MQLRGAIRRDGVGIRSDGLRPGAFGNAHAGHYERQQSGDRSAGHRRQETRARQPANRATDRSGLVH
jgi:hypothetical protein